AGKAAAERAAATRAAAKRAPWEARHRPVVGGWPVPRRRPVVRMAGRGPTHPGAPAPQARRVVRVGPPRVVLAAKARVPAGRPEMRVGALGVMRARAARRAPAGSVAAARRALVSERRGPRPIPPKRV